MHTRHLAYTSLVLLFTVCSAGCRDDKADGAGASATADASSSAKPKPTSAQTGAAPSSAPPAAPPAAPSPVDLEAMTWTDGETKLTLRVQDLSKPCLLEGVSMVLPDKAQIKAMTGSRGCTVRAFGDDGPYIFIINDELNGKMPLKEDMKGIKRTIEETADSWLIEDGNPKTGFAGRVTRKLGDHVTWCTGNANGKPNGEQIARGLVKLCSTMSFSAPAK